MKAISMSGRYCNFELRLYSIFNSTTNNNINCLQKVELRTLYSAGLYAHKMIKLNAIQETEFTTCFISLHILCLVESDKMVLS